MLICAAGDIHRPLKKRWGDVMSATDIAVSADLVGIGTPRLLFSFWDLCLENLPVGRFVRRQVPIDEARELIRAARAGGRLHCVTRKDILAPYGVRHLRRHIGLCALLSTEFNIAMSVKDFTSMDSGPPPLRYINPLQCVQLAIGDQMLVATCNCVMKPKSGDIDSDRRFSLAPDSLRFDLIDAKAGTDLS